MGTTVCACAKLPDFVYFHNLSGLDDAIGQSQQITVCWCLNVLNSSKLTYTLSSIFSVATVVVCLVRHSWQGFACSC